MSPCSTTLPTRAILLPLSARNLLATMPTMTIPSAKLRRLKKLAAEAAAKSSSGEGGHHQRANLRSRRSSPPPPVPRRENRVTLMALAAACDSETRAAGADDYGRDGPAAAAIAAGFGARVLVRAPTAAALVRAVVLSGADEDGYLEVVYEGAGGEDPFATVRVHMDQIVAEAPPRVVTATSYASGGAGQEPEEASSPPGAEARLKMLARAAI